MKGNKNVRPDPRPKGRGVRVPEPGVYFGSRGARRRHKSISLTSRQAARYSTPNKTYTLRRSSRAQYMSLRVLPGGAVMLTVPEKTPLEKAEEFMRSRAEWLARAIERMAHLVALPQGRRNYALHKEEARTLLAARVRHWNAVLKQKYGRVAIKNTRRNWGSCSAKGNLNFSYKLLFLPQELIDYVVVHELCHLKERNHSAAFWDEVARVLPNYKALRAELRHYR